MTDTAHVDGSNGAEHLGPLRLDAIRLGQGTDFEHAHLRGCAHCREGLAMLRRLDHELAPAASAPFEIPPDRRRVILANAERELAVIARARRRSVRPRAWLPFALAATLLVGLGLGRLWFASPNASERHIALQERVTPSEPAARPRSAAPAGEKPRPGDTEQGATATVVDDGTLAVAPNERPSPHESRGSAPLDLPARPSWMPPSRPRAEPSAGPRSVIAQRPDPALGAAEKTKHAPDGSTSRVPDPPVVPTAREDRVPDPRGVGIAADLPITRAPAARAYPSAAQWPRGAYDDPGTRWTIKLATILPDGAPGTSELKGAGDAIQQASGDKVELKLYLGVSGDEKDIVKKLEIGQLQAAQLTGLGLAEIVPSIHVLDLPFFFTSYAQVDRVYDGVLSYFQQAFREKGFEFLGFTETGFVYLYSNLKIESLADLKQAKLWAAEGDPLTAAFVGEAKMQSVPLGIPDVLQSLRTGLIDTVYGPPSGVIGLQWFTQIKYAQIVPFVHATGGVVMTTRVFDAMDPNLQASLTKTMADQARLITQSMRKVNEDSKQEIQKAGVMDLPRPGAEMWRQLGEIAQRVTEFEAGHLYPKELLERVRRLRDEAAAAEASR